MTPEQLAFEAGWNAGFECATHHPNTPLERRDKALTTDYEAYKREIAEPLRCRDCQAMIMQGGLCADCQRIDYKGYGTE